MKILRIGCTYCEDDIFHTKHSNHERKERKEGEDLVECAICGIKLRNKRIQVQHYQKEHPSEKIYNCKQCKYGTNYLPNLKTHTNSIHEKKIRQCPHCSY